MPFKDKIVAYLTIFYPEPIKIMMNDESCKTDHRLFENSSFIITYKQGVEIFVQNFNPLLISVLR